LPQSTTLITACEAHIRLDNDAGIPIDISGSSNAVEIGLAQDISAFYTMYRGRMPLRNSAREDGSVRMQAVYSVTANESIDLLTDWYFNHPNTRRTLSVYLPDYTISSDVYSGEVLLESLSIPAVADDPNAIPVQATFLPSGAWTKATKAT